jgi:hypothetical protein
LSVATLAGVSTADRFWTRRLRWRLIGAWRWPLFLLLTIADGLIVHWLPPTGVRALLVPAIVICGFANLFLIGAIAPWLARRLVARQGERPPSATFPPANHLELLTDRIAAIVLALATVGLLAAGAGNHKVVVAATDRLARGGAAARDYALIHGASDIRRNARSANINSHELQQDGLFRMCIPYDDPTRAFCMYVDASRQPPTVRPDGDSRPNGALFQTP